MGFLLQLKCSTLSGMKFDHIAIQRETAIFQDEFIYYSISGTIDDSE